MKTKILAWFLLAGSLGAADFRTNFTLEFNYPRLDSNITFYAYTSTNIQQPLTNWITCGCAVMSTNILVTANPAYGAQYYVVRGSNSWGLGDFSNIAGLPVPPLSDISLKLK